MLFNIELAHDFFLNSLALLVPLHLLDAARSFDEANLPHRRAAWTLAHCGSHESPSLCELSATKRLDHLTGQWLCCYRVSVDVVS